MGETQLNYLSQLNHVRRAITSAFTVW